MVEAVVQIRMSRAEARALVDELREPITGHIRPQSHELLGELERALDEEGERLDEALVAGEV